MGVDSKTCTSCGLPKSLDQFSVRRASRDGLNASCRECKNKADRAAYYCPPSDRKTHKLTQEQIDGIVQRYLSGVPVRALAKEFGVKSGVVSYYARKFGISNRSKPPTDAERAEIIRLRQDGESVTTIAASTGRSEGSVWGVLAAGKVTVSADVAKKNMRTYPVEVDAKIIELRATGADRREIAKTVGCSVRKVKTVLAEHSVTLPMNKRQENAYVGRLEKNPDAMAYTRSFFAPDHNERIRRAVGDTYSSNPSLGQAAAERGKRYWASLSDEERERIAQGRSGMNSGQFTAMLGRNGVDSAGELLDSYASKMGGVCLGEYQGAHIPVLWRCGEGHEFMSAPGVVKYGHWCPKCANVGPSKPQIEVFDYIHSLAPDAVLSDRTVIRPLELDIYVPSKKVGIEYNGLFWHSSGASEKYDPRRHHRKALACREAGVKMLAIYSDEWESKQDLIKSMIRWRLGCFSGTKLDARKLELRRLAKNADFSDFFKRNHIDGHAVAQYAYSLWFGDTMVMCASVRRNHASELEIARLATDYDYSVRGGASRLVHAILSEIREPLTSYSNNRLSSGAVYTALGFEKIAENSPSYWYTDGLSTRIWRFKCRRRNDPDILAQYPTEKAQALGGVFSLGVFGDDRPLYQIHDYGHIKWRLPGPGSPITIPP